MTATRHPLDDLTDAERVCAPRAAKVWLESDERRLDGLSSEHMASSLAKALLTATAEVERLTKQNDLLLNLAISDTAARDSLRNDAIRAEWQVAAMMPVVEAAKAWELADVTVEHLAANELSIAVGAYLAATKDKP